MTTTSEHAGTIRYLAPELVASDVSVPPTPASDVYALGCLGLQVRRQGLSLVCKSGLKQRDIVYLFANSVLKPVKRPTRDHDTPGSGPRPAPRERTTTSCLAFSSYLGSSFGTLELGSSISFFGTHSWTGIRAYRFHTPSKLDSQSHRLSGGRLLGPLWLA